MRELPGVWSGAVMYLRTTARANKDGSVVRYLALAHNQRVGAATKANVLLNLGREDRLDPDGLRRLVRSINRYLGEPDTDGTDATGSDKLQQISTTDFRHYYLWHVQQSRPFSTSRSVWQSTHHGILIVATRVTRSIVSTGP